MTNAELIRILWRAVEARDWTTVEALCAPEMSYTLPQSGEIHDRAGYLRANKEYPGDWHVSLDHLIDGGEWLITEVTISFPDHSDRGVNLFRCADHKIVELREYWPEPFEIPAWRMAWRSKQEEDP